jgi:hypothetical protein
VKLLDKTGVGDKFSYPVVKAYTANRGLTLVLETVIEEKKKRGELKAKRELLFNQYLKHPMDTRLALEIKTLDDQLAEDTRQVKRKTGTRN